MNRIFNLFRFPRVAASQSDDEPLRAVVALGGGGARGLAHLGVMEAIQETEVETTRIVGVSIGSLVGAMCAAEPDIHRVQSDVIQLLVSPDFQSKHRLIFGSNLPGEESADGLFSWYGRIKQFLSAHRRLRRAATGPALLSDALLRDAIEILIPDIDIADLQTPLSIVAVDLLSGHTVALEQGPLRRAVLASSAVPGIFPPVAWDEMLLCDVGVVDSMPIDVACSYNLDLTIAVDVAQDHSAIHNCPTALDVMMRMDDIGERLLRRRVADAADIVIRPDIGGVAWFDFGNPEKLIEAGRRAARISLESLRGSQAA